MRMPTGGESCVTVATGEEWRALEQDKTEYMTEGSALNVAVKVFEAEELLSIEAAAQEEEIAAVLEGTFYIKADDEEYELTVGEGIMIPPNTHRQWRCTSSRGVLYRVLTRSQEPVKE